ncbi:type II toxin-antitoxin system RelE/ParE family toxin [Laribacter hongkongensis]|uniref:type II toxin-antitoxin system RelE/ParE family toxin n=1 Tax=Laribacter hongkongensis TaxID=168471 RepID=UPI001EFE2EC1|nr:type II toxin-antitoxin system RelE/ParE family toxin [Laribacter hongkongensis]MCG9124284.1 type II toxin-antitoxin system RelE/ParE family toxin [Laribacter hongkongensis]
MNILELRRYQRVDGTEPMTDWLASLRDRQARARVETRLARVALGNFGDSKPCRDGVNELRIDWGPGYRVYYARHGLTIVLLLLGGDKRSQDADIEEAINYWQDYKRRNA